MRNSVLVVLGLLLVSSLDPETGPHENLNAVTWMQQAVEYQAAVRQTFVAATRSLEQTLSLEGEKNRRGVGDDGGRTGVRLPPAIISDLDETLLDNSPYQARLIAEGVSHSSERWRQWVEEKAATALPGALEFLKRAKELQVRIYYVSNRSAEEEPATRANLASLGFPIAEDYDCVLLKGEQPDWTSDKSSRRKFVAEQNAVLLLLGDDLGDFVAASISSPKERAEAFARESERFGRSWFMLPNPSYGSWQRVLAGGVNLTRSEQVALERRLLDLRRP